MVVVVPFAFTTGVGAAAAAAAAVVGGGVSTFPVVGFLLFRCVAAAFYVVVFFTLPVVAVLVFAFSDIGLSFVAAAAVVVFTSKTVGASQNQHLHLSHSRRSNPTL